MDMDVQGRIMGVQWMYKNIFFSFYIQTFSLILKPWYNAWMWVYKNAQCMDNDILLYTPPLLFT